MRRELPSPTALLAFEASARLLSFKQAAGELNVSPAAVSRQIHNLEEFVGQPLFQRLHRSVALTAAGERLAAPVHEGFVGMAEAIKALRSGLAERQVTVGTTVGFAFYWLMPRLAQFSAARPDITLNQIVADEPVDFARGRADLAVRYGAGKWPGLDARFLFADRIYPVCSPAFLERAGTPESLADLEEHPLLETHGIADDLWLDWATWFRRAGHRASGMRRRYLNYPISVQLALAGEGYALGWHSFIGNLVEEGRLVRPLAAAIESPGAFYLTYPSGREFTDEMLFFTEWLIDAACN